MAKNEKFLNLIQEYLNDRNCMELLRFFGKYPNARFNRLAIVHGLFNGDAHGNSHIIEKALKRIVDDRLIYTATENGIILYSLTEEKYSRSAVCEFAELDLLQRQLLLKANRVINNSRPVGKNENTFPQLRLSPGLFRSPVSVAVK